jgi:hypothetical protein
MRNRGEKGPSPTLAAIYGRQADISWLHLSRKQGRLLPRWERYPRLPPFDLTLNERNPMKPVIRYQTQLLFRKSYKPVRLIRIRPAHKATSVVRPARAGPQFNKYEYTTH